MEKNDEISRVISLIFTLRHLFHEKAVKGTCLKASPLQIITLRFIKEKNPLMKEIADYLTITPPSATALVNNLIDLDMVRREEDKNDRRIVRIIISKKGKKYLEEKTCEVFQSMRRNLETLTKKEQQELGKILGKIVEAYKNND